MFFHFLKNVFCQQMWALSTIQKGNRSFGQWYNEMMKENMEPDALLIIFMSQYLGRNITLISGKADEWNTLDMAYDIVLVYKGDNIYAPTDVGTYLFVCSFKYCFFYNRNNVKSNEKEL